MLLLLNPYRFCGSVFVRSPLFCSSVSEFVLLLGSPCFPPVVVMVTLSYAAQRKEPFVTHNPFHPPPPPHPPFSFSSARLRFLTQSKLETDWSHVSQPGPDCVLASVGRKKVAAAILTDSHRINGHNSSNMFPHSSFHRVVDFDVKRQNKTSATFFFLSRFYVKLNEVTGSGFVDSGEKTRSRVQLSRVNLMEEFVF
ncbi:uncharacterized protein V6R79_004358 [Siganus canaliculatus]